MPNGGTIRIDIAETSVDENFLYYQDLQEKGKHALISFSDTGCGIPKEHLDKIFEPFLQQKKLGKERGLGLLWFTAL